LPGIFNFKINARALRLFFYESKKGGEIMERVREERPVTVHRPDGIILHGTLHIGGDGGIIVYDTVRAHRGPRADSEIVPVDPNEHIMTPVAEPFGGYQKVEVAGLSARSAREEVLYLPVSSKFGH
jgi:hypothetical protein